MQDNTRFETNRDFKAAILKMQLGISENSFEARLKYRTEESFVNESGSVVKEFDPKYQVTR